MAIPVHKPSKEDVLKCVARFDEIEPPGSRVELEQLRATVDRMLETGTPDPALRALELDRIRAMLKALTIRFHLRNKAEQVHIARVNRQREREATDAAPRPESLREAVSALAAEGYRLIAVAAKTADPSTVSPVQVAAYCAPARWLDRERTKGVARGRARSSPSRVARAMSWP